MNLALIRRNFSASGGAELYLQRLITALLAQNHEVHLYAENWTAQPGVQFHQIHASGSRAQRPRRFAEAVKTALASARHDCVLSLERTISQDVYRAGDGLHRVWLEQRKRFTTGWRKPFIGLGGFHRAMLQLERETFGAANTRRIIVNSEMVRREILTHFNFPADRIHLVRNGIDLARFQNIDRAQARAQLGLRDDQYTLLFVGSGWERKGLRYVLQAFARFRSAAANAKLLVVGKGPHTTNPPGVEFLGVRQDVGQIYAAADLFVFPPIYEPSANVCFEALAAGLPVITTATNGASELIEQKVNGTVLPDPSDTNALLKVIQSWRRKGFVRVTTTADLSLDRNVRETLAILELAASEKA